MSGSLQDAGGVGGLLLEQNSNGEFLPVYDGNGNIIAYKNSNGKTIAAYSYDPFGNVISHIGMDFTYKFSTKPQDDLSGMYYYGYRFYQPNIGRWINRDPIGESGGGNLYGLVGNDSINGFDYCGLFKAYGNWCGPNWTGGYKKPWNDLSTQERRNVKKPIDAVDAACQAHDKAYGRCDRLLCELSKERCKAQADKKLVDDIENYLASADGVVEMASVTKGSGLRQHHISVVKNAIQTQYFGRIRRIKRMSK